MDLSDKRYGAPPFGVVRLSQSSVEAYLRCGVAWNFKQIFTRRVTIAQAVGTGAARGAYEDNSAKARGSQVLTDDIIDAAVCAYDDEVTNSELVDRKADIGPGRDLTATYAEAWSRRVSPTLEGVIGAEVRVVASVDDALQLAGTMDYVTNAGVGDLKTGKSWSQSRADQSRQLSAYGLLYYARWGSPPPSCWVDSLAALKGGVKAVRLVSSRGWRDIESYRMVVMQAYRCMCQGVFLPAPEGAWWCSERYCEWYRTCKYVTAREVNDE